MIRRNRPWAPEDDIRLRTLLESGASTALVAAKLKRSISATKGRASAVGISLKKDKAKADGEQMSRLRRFYEKVPYGGTLARVAYATNKAALPESSPDAEWTEDATFNAGDAIFANPSLKEVYKEAILKGCAFEKPKS
jgi:hypothetical protein